MGRSTVQEVFTEVKDAELVRVRRRQIVAAAMGLFARDGYHSTAVRDIARGTGVSVGSIYTYFPSKSDILKYACEEFAHAFRTQFLAGASQTPADALAQFTAAFKTLVRLLDEQSDLALTLYRETASLDPTTRQRIIELDLDIREVFAGLLRTGVEERLLRPHNTMLRAQTAVFLAHMWVLKRWWLRSHISLDAYVHEQVRVLFGDALCLDNADFYTVNDGQNRDAALRGGRG